MSVTETKHVGPSWRRSVTTISAEEKLEIRVLGTLEVDCNITVDSTLDILTNLFLMRGVPKHIRSDNGSEFIAEAIRDLGKQAGLEMLYIQPASPWENGFAESFFSRLRDELLNVEEFMNLESC